MKILKSLSILFILAILTGLLSCKKNNISTVLPNNPELPSLLNYFDVTTKQTNAAFGLSFSTTMEDKNNENAPLLFQGLFISNKGPAIKGGKVTCASYNFMCDDNNYYGNNTIISKNIVGKKQAFSFQKPISFEYYPQNGAPGSGGNTGLGSTRVDSLYIPELLNILTGTPTSVNFGEDKIKIGHEITWVPDPKNISMGVVIAVEYTPTSVGNEAISGQYPKYIKNGRVINDNGSVILDQSLFIDIPVGSIVSVSLGRANYKLAADSQNTPYTLFAYNFKYSSFKYVLN